MPQDFFVVLSVAEVTRRLKTFAPLPAETAALEDPRGLEGRVLAADVTARDDVPLTNRSGMDGYAVARSVRARRCGVPILMLTARSSLEDRVEGLNAGADYYLTKPFDTRELLACINALLRRQGAQVDALSFGNTTLDLASGTLCCADKSVRLSAREFDVMRLLLQSGGSNLSKEALLSRVWGFDSNAVENSVEVYVGFLRKKLASIGSNVRIESVRRLGYHLEVASSC